MRRILLAAGCLVPASAAAAQSPPADPISGTWSGDAGLTLANRTPIKFELKFDGAALISGTLSGPGEVRYKAGRFDPTTGALRLEVEVTRDGTTGLFVMEGYAINGMATGKVSDGTQSGSFRLQKAGGDGAADAYVPLRTNFTQVSGWVSKAAELVPAEKYSFQATKAVRSFGQLIAHVADSYNYYCAVASGRNIQWSDPVEKGKTDKATVVAKLQEALAGCTAIYAGTNGQLGALTDNVAHTSLHYGNIITYVRLLGMVPPSS